MTGPGYESTSAATSRRRYVARSPVNAPITAAFGSRDLVLLPHESRHLDQLPADTRVAAPPGCGHAPTSDDPIAVVSLIAVTADAAADTAVPETG